MPEKSGRPMLIWMDVIQNIKREWQNMRTIGDMNLK